MKQITTISIIAAFLMCSCGGMHVSIDKNKIEGNTTIVFNDKNITIKPNQFFKLSESGLDANAKKITIGHTAVTSKVINYFLKRCKNGNITSYDITISNPNYGKPYYGKIMFFNTNKKNQLEAVSRYREISIGSEYFESATRGRIAILYEYFTRNLAMTGQSGQVPTWVIIMSDEPV
jgi:hypothetical protein